MTIGLLYQLPASGEPMVGMQVAVDQMVAAFDRHGAEDYVVFSGPRAVRALAERLKPQRIQVRGAESLREQPIDAWHDLAFDAKRAFAVRRTLGASFPITLTHHTLSYRELAHDIFLRIVLEGAEHDSIVCSSTAARDAVDKLLGHVAQTLNSNHGTQLRYRGRFDVIPLGVDVERFRPRDRDDARARCNLPRDMFMILWVGRLSSIDKADLLPLVQAVAEVVRAHPEKSVVLMCVGGDRLGDRFGQVILGVAQELGIAKHVLVANQIDRAGMPLVHAAADVLVSPVDNIQETFGLTPVEAMACGVPQIVSDWNGYRDTVIDGETGFRVPTLWARCDDDVRAMAPFHDAADDHLFLAQSVVVDPAALRDRLEQLIVNDDLRQRMSASSRKRAEQHYAERRIVEQHEALWRELRDDSFRPPPRAIDDVPYFDVFSHYATRTLGPDETIDLTDRGRELIGGNLRLRFSVPWPGLHDPTTYQRVLASLPGHVRDLAPDARTMRALLWLLKYGYAYAAP
jgi:D-inositol-3-phosphate glycosyltransferase